MTAIIFTTAVRATPLLLLAWVCTILLRRASADLRHKIWVAGFFGILALMIPVPVPKAAQIAIITTTFVTSVAADSARGAIFPWATLWGAGTALLLLRYLVGVYRLMRMTRDARPADAADVRISAAVASPLTWGAIHPTILLPAYAEDWPTGKR
ncbi:MAG: hypothetical protein ABI824_16370, partial [Acidobacteriota bacterium]